MRRKGESKRNAGVTKRFNRSEDELGQFPWR